MRNPRSDLARLLGAAAFAARKHSTQRRKDAEASPYINHPLALADVLANEGGVLDIEVLCAALLHDTIEDTDTSADELRAGFGAAIADIVLEVSDDKALPKQARNKLIAKPSLLRLDGETRTITYLSCRIANASEIEQTFRDHPGQLIRLFEKRLGALYDAVLEHGGTVEHFGSAGFAAFWNAPLAEPGHAAQATAAATRMMQMLREQSTTPLRRQQPIAPPLKLAIGIASGPAACGLFGGAYSVAGACVPRAEELRAACAEYGFAALADGPSAR